MTCALGYQDSPTRDYSRPQTYSKIHHKTFLTPQLICEVKSLGISSLVMGQLKISYPPVIVPYATIEHVFDDAQAFFRKDHFHPLPQLSRLGQDLV